MWGDYTFVCLNLRFSWCENILWIARPESEILMLWKRPLNCKTSLSLPPFCIISLLQFIFISLFSFLPFLQLFPFNLFLLSLLSQVGQDIPTENSDSGWNCWEWTQHKKGEEAAMRMFVFLLLRTHGSSRWKKETGTWRAPALGVKKG